MAPELRDASRPPATAPSNGLRPATTPLIKGEFRVLAVLSMLTGALLLCESFGFLIGVHKLWPVFPAFVGVGLVLLFHHRGRRDLILLGLGTYFIGASVFFFVLNFTSWEYLASVWPVFIGLLGIASSIAAAFSHRVGWVLGASGTFLVLLAICFYLVFGVTGRLWPVSLILFGLWVLLVTRTRDIGGRWHWRWKP